jgi:hypothetical protein
MKKNSLLLVFVLVLFAARVTAQITLDHRTVKNTYLTKFHLSGYKFIEVNMSLMNIYVYNINHSLFRTIPIPAQPFPITGVYFVSENLFDLDAGMEFVLNTYDAPSTVSYLHIYNEDGSLIMARDSTFLAVQASTPIFENQSQLFFDGAVTKIKLPIGYYSTYLYYEYYNLPGSIPCSDCSQGVTTGLTGEAESRELDAEFYPNPASSYLKLKYRLPPGAKRAQLKVYDSMGKQMQDMEITDSFDFIYLPVNYNNGLYLYSLFVDGQLIKSEKIILTK